MKLYSHTISAGPRSRARSADSKNEAVSTALLVSFYRHDFIAIQSESFRKKRFSVFIFNHPRKELFVEKFVLQITFNAERDGVFSRGCSDGTLDDLFEYKYTVAGPMLFSNLTRLGTIEKSHFIPRGRIPFTFLYIPTSQGF